MNKTLETIAGHHEAATEAQTPDEKDVHIKQAKDANAEARVLLNDAVSAVKDQKEEDKHLKEEDRLLKQRVEEEIAVERDRIDTLQKAEAAANAKLAQAKNENKQLQFESQSGNQQNPANENDEGTINKDPRNCYLVRL